MPFQVISMKNKSFWSRVISALAGFALVITAMAVVFPVNQNADVSSQGYAQTTTTVEEQQEE